ncbi:hypothetical protein [Paraburkholderia hospita]|uniref:hypothetical protein n=1 Tax=Paraburkholderia hospita TaxID=169430 RepID=UPI0008A772FF|nr:hypothetical protein [Paraburkholderia hospita]SEH89554.1 hypothetical protein SAMN05192544_1011132 [Paraburkholderia hospita]
MSVQIDEDTQVVTLLDRAAAALAGDWFALPRSRPRRAIQAVVSGNGAVTASVVIEGSNDAANALPLGTIDLTGASPQTDGFLSDAEWAFVRARVVSVTGTGAVVSVTMGI